MRKRIFPFLSEDYTDRTVLLATAALLVNVAFALLNGVAAVLERSVWYAALAGYYVALIALRGGVVLKGRSLRKKFAGKRGLLAAKWKVWIGCGAFLLAFELAMAAAVTSLIVGGRAAQGGEAGKIYAIATAAYTFYKAVMAIVRLARARRRGDPIAQSLRAINIADACISMVSLTVLMTATFGETGMLGVKAGVGFGAVVLTAGMAVWMILFGFRRLRECRAQDREPGCPPSAHTDGRTE